MKSECLKCHRITETNHEMKCERCGAFKVSCPNCNNPMKYKGTTERKKRLGYTFDCPVCDTGIHMPLGRFETIPDTEALLSAEQKSRLKADPKIDELSDKELLKKISESLEV